MASDASGSLNRPLLKRLKEWYLTHVFVWKCAYCECPVETHNAHLDHWRPRRAVTHVDEHGNEVTPTRNGAPHPGYWWLAYDWANLVPTCGPCNSSAKGTKFPIAGTYAFSPEDAVDHSALNALEHPLLLHPFFGPRPEDHVAFYDDGTAYGKSPYGESTIKVMALNRDGLVEARRRHARDVFGKVLVGMGSAQTSPSSHEALDDDVNRRIDYAVGPAAAYSQAVRPFMQSQLAALQARIRFASEPSGR